MVEKPKIIIMDWVEVLFYLKLCYFMVRGIQTELIWI